MRQSRDREPQGFFPPEMGFNCYIAKIVAKLGYKWIIVDELSFPRDKGPIDYSKLYSMEGLDDFYIHFRERQMSWTILSGQVFFLYISLFFFLNIDI